jgi:hypothetical protein
MFSSPTAATTNQERSESWSPVRDLRSPSPMLDDENSTDDDDFDMPLLQQDPLRYFLTPATPMEEELEFDFDFDAGIEDPNSPREIVRSISPSNLGGFSSYKKTSSKTDDCAIIDDDSDDEDYIRFGSSKSFPSGLPDFDFDRPKSAGTTPPRTKDGFLSPTAFHVGSPRGRPAKRFAPPRRSFQARSRGLSMQRCHSWQEPSPDIWAVEEEPEKETMSEMGMSTEDLVKLFKEENKTRPIYISAAKPKKRVRFLLPEKE